MTVLDTLTLALGVDPKGIDAGLAEAKQKIDAGAKSMAQGLMTPLKAALGAVAAGLSLGAITNQYLNQADAIGKMADSIGADIEELQAWGEAAARAGGSAEAFNGSITTLNKMLQMTAATGKGPAVMALEQFGIKAKDASGKARDTFEILRDLAGKMEGMDKQKAIGFGQKLGLDRGTIMLLQSGRAAVDDLIKRQKELGVYTKEDAEIAAKANDAIADLGQALKAGAAIIMRHIVPAITWVADKMTAVVQFFKRHQPLVVTGLGAIAAIISARMIPALIKMAAANAKAFAPFMVLAAIISAIALVVDDFWTYLHGGESALEGLWKQLGDGPELLAKVTKAWETTKQVASQFFEALKPYLANIIKLIGAFVAAWAFGKVLAGLSSMVGSIMNIGKALKAIGMIIRANPLGIFLTVLSLIIIYWDDIIAVSKKFFDNLGEWVSAAGKWLSQLWTDFLAKTKAIWEDIKASIKQKWEDIKAGASEMWEGIKTKSGEIWDNIKNTVTTKMKALWNTLVSIFAWDNIKTAANNAWETIKTTAITKVTALWDSVTTLLNWDNIKASALASWDGIKTSVTTKMTALWDSLKSIFAWETWETAFANIFKINFDEIGQKISKLFSWDEWKRAFAGIFDFVPDMSKIIDAIKDGFKKAWNWILENIPGAKLFFDTGKNMVDAAKKVDASKGEQLAEDNIIDINDKDRYTPPPPRPTPADGVSSQAAAAATTNNVSNNLTQNDSRSTTVNIYANTDNPQAIGNAAAKALDKKPAWAAQAANGNAFAGGY
jgi:hypothetical protein